MNDITCSYCKKLIGSLNKSMVNQDFNDRIKEEILHDHINNKCVNFNEYKLKINSIYSKLLENSLMSFDGEYYIMEEAQYVRNSNANELYIIIITMLDIHDNTINLRLNHNNIELFGYIPHKISNESFYKFYDIIKWYYSSDDNELIVYDKSSDTFDYIICPTWDINYEYVKADEFMNLRLNILRGNLIQTTHDLFDVVTLDITHKNNN